jgi:hypothetical protein
MRERQRPASGRRKAIVTTSSARNRCTGLHQARLWICI